MFATRQPILIIYEWHRHNLQNWLSSHAQGSNPDLFCQCRTPAETWLGFHIFSQNHDSRNDKVTFLLFGRHKILFMGQWYTIHSLIHCFSHRITMEVETLAGKRRINNFQLSATYLYLLDTVPTVVVQTWLGLWRRGQHVLLPDGRSCQV